MYQDSGKKIVILYILKILRDHTDVNHTERDMLDKEGRKTEVTRLISARLATNFERGLYYGKYD